MAYQGKGALVAIVFDDVMAAEFTLKSGDGVLLGIAFIERNSTEVIRLIAELLELFNFMPVQESISTPNLVARLAVIGAPEVRG